jgi:hypothetical protein
MYLPPIFQNWLYIIVLENSIQPMIRKNFSYLALRVMNAYAEDFKRLDEYLRIS